MTPRHRPRVLVAGGGVAAVETLLALHHLAGAQVSIELLAPELAFVHRPSSVATPFGLGAPDPLDLAEIAQHLGASLRRGSLNAVDAAHRLVVVAPTGEAIPYDRLVVAVGAVARPSVPGAISFAGPQDAPAIEALLDAVAGGKLTRIAFTMPAQASWSLPVYELAVMAAVELRSRGVSGAELTVVTPEPEPLRIFGHAAGEAVRSMLADRGITLETGARPIAMREGRLTLDGADALAVDAVVALPELQGPHIDGLPADGDGFVPVDSHGRVPGVASVYAAGDATTFPIKQGGLATQQADAAAAAIALDVGARPDAPPFRPILRGLLLTGGAPLYLRAELSRPSEPATARTLRGEASGRALWWPPGKVAGRYLAPYLADARPLDLGAEPLVDRVPSGTNRTPEGDDAFDLAMLLAEEDAKVGDYRQALHALDAAAALSSGVLPDTWEQNRARWQRELARTG